MLHVLIILMWVSGCLGSPHKTENIGELETKSPGCFSIYPTEGNSYVLVPTRGIKIWFKFCLNITEGDCVNVR